MAGPGMQQSQNLSLQQVLAPQLQQSLLILQAPLLELRNLVQQEMETNPVLDDGDRKTAEVIIGNVDDNGFLRATPEEMSMNTGIPQDDFETTLTLIQSFY